MKNQALFSSKYKSKKLKCRLLQFLFGALRVNTYQELNLILEHSLENCLVSRDVLKHFYISHSCTDTGSQYLFLGCQVIYMYRNSEIRQYNLTLSAPETNIIKLENTA